jgi:crossover junction endodeoxyribonuclease RuvC
MKILGIDPGTAITGYAIVDTDNDLTCLEYGVIRTIPEQKDEERLLIINSELDAIIKKHKPDIASIEKVFYFKNAKTVIPVSQARGVILFTLAKNEIPITEFTPLQVKTATTGYGRATKKQVQEMVKTLLNLEKIPKPDDAADAIAIAICCSYCI